LRPWVVVCDLYLGMTTLDNGKIKAVRIAETLPSKHCSVNTKWCSLGLELFTKNSRLALVIVERLFFRRQCAHFSLGKTLLSKPVSGLCGEYK